MQRLYFNVGLIQMPGRRKQDGTSTSMIVQEFREGWENYFRLKDSSKQPFLPKGEYGNITLAEFAKNNRKLKGLRFSAKTQSDAPCICVGKATFIDCWFAPSTIKYWDVTFYLQGDSLLISKVELGKWNSFDDCPDIDPKALDYSDLGKVFVVDKESMTFHPIPAQEPIPEESVAEAAPEITQESLFREALAEKGVTAHLCRLAILEKVHENSKLSRKEIVEACSNWSSRTVYRHIKTLECAGILEPEESVGASHEMKAVGIKDAFQETFAALAAEKGWSFGNKRVSN